MPKTFVGVTTTTEFKSSKCGDTPKDPNRRSTTNWALTFRFCDILKPTHPCTNKFKQNLKRYKYFVFSVCTHFLSQSTVYLSNPVAPSCYQVLKNHSTHTHRHAHTTNANKAHLHTVLQVVPAEPREKKETGCFGVPLPENVRRRVALQTETNTSLSS